MEYITRIDIEMTQSSTETWYLAFFQATNELT